ncbi:MAG: hypothetical protein KF854_17645 [Nitrospira sp.]|nr:hypothetical protein [Nitrospira sp.]
MAHTPIRGLASYLKFAKLFCKYKDKFANNIRPHVPAEHVAKFDALNLAISAFCEVVNLIDWIGDDIGEA